MKAWHYMTKDDVRDLAGDALNVACKHIQDIIGVETGDLAGMYLQGCKYIHSCGQACG